jgi:hypothetical protein
MVSESDAVVNKAAVVVKALDARAAGHTVGRSRRPYRPTEVAEVVQTPLLLESLV